jgi:hypothetical protein
MEASARDLSVSNTKKDSTSAISVGVLVTSIGRRRRPPTLPTKFTIILGGGGTDREYYCLHNLGRETAVEEITIVSCYCRRA